MLSQQQANAAARPTAPRPESLLLAFFGAHLLGREAAVAVGSVIDVLGRLGVGEHAIRATLKRMTQRGLLCNLRRGRHAYLCLTPHAEAILRQGAARMDAGIVNPDWDGHWTLLAFSVPESRREDRHALRTQLSWAGFGLLRNALWIAPSSADVAGTLAALRLLDYVKIFRAQALTPGDPRLLAAEAWDLSELANGYHGFLKRWERGPRTGLDDLSRQILLEAEWLVLIREDPRLPLDLLPEGWPGIRAEEVFATLRHALAVPARRQAETTLEWMSLDPARAESR